MYYLRTKPAANAIQFTVDKSKLKEAAANSSGDSNDANGKEEGANGEDASGDGIKVAAKEVNMADMICSIQNKDDCLSCGS